MKTELVSLRAELAAAPLVDEGRSVGKVVVRVGAD